VKPKVLFLLPPAWVDLGHDTFASPAYEVVIANKDSYKPEEIDYFVGFRPPKGFLKTLTNLKLVISLGAGVDGFMGDPDFPRHLKLVRFTDPSLAHEMAQYVTMHVLIVHRQQRLFDQAQKDSQWHQWMLPRATDQTRIGILGMGVIGGAIAERLKSYGFVLSGWSRTRKQIAGVKSFAGEAELSQFLGQCDYLVCVLPNTPETLDMVDAKFLGQLPKGAWLINVARGSILVENDLLMALDGDHLGGAVLDVFRIEPLPKEHPFWRHPKITLTPHVAGLTDPRMARSYIEDTVTRHEAGGPLQDVVDMDRGY
jgi:glyoxylate/hydroxypyruvate reductase A